MSKPRTRLPNNLGLYECVNTQHVGAKWLHVAAFDTHTKTKNPMSWCKACCLRYAREKRARDAVRYAMGASRPAWYQRRLEARRGEI